MAHDPDSARSEAGDADRARARQEHRGTGSGVGARIGAAIKELVIVLAMALTLSFIVKTFLIQAFFIPSESMEQTLLVGDRVVVSKLTPTPFELNRGDVVVFDDPGGWLSPVPETNHGTVLNGMRDALMFVGLLPDTSEGHLIKRVVGLPGDHVQCCDAEGRLLVNGEPIDETPYLNPGVEASDLEFNITVPTGRIWVMGDNRSDSSDSRFHDPDGNGDTGSVPIDLVVGRAVATVWPFDRTSRLSGEEEVFSQVPDAGSNRSLAPPVREPHLS